MIAVDTNVLIYANRSELDLHDRAHGRLTELAEGMAPWGLPVVVAWGFLRIVTQPVFDPPTPIGQALDFVEALTGSPSVRVLRPGLSHWELLRTTVEESRAGGRLLTDAVIVALCREHGIDTVLSNDRDFRRFGHVDLELLDA